MKKTLLVALAVMAGALFCQAANGKKDKKKKKDKQEQVVTPLTTHNDSLSYALGIDATNGLIPYLTRELDVDTAYIDKFIEGFKTFTDKNADKKAINAYSAGMQIASMVEKRMIPGITEQMNGVVDSIQPDIFKEAFLAAVTKQYGAFNETTAGQFINNAREEHIKQIIKKEEDFLAHNATLPGVKTTASGLQYKVLREGNGTIPTLNDEVEVNYEGHFIDGKEFDSSYKRGESAKFQPTGVIKGWTEALTMMPVGSKWEIYVPYKLGYGEQPRGSIPAYSTLIFTIELLNVEKKAEN